MKSIFGVFLSTLGVSMVGGESASAENLKAKFETSTRNYRINTFCR